MGIVDEIVHSIGRDVRKDAGELLVPILLAVAGGLTGAAGVGFLTAWVYLTLRIAVGQASAALLTALGLAIVAAGLLVFARNRLAKKTAADPPVSP
jgi:high-affinity Fe2+/Pb2+ permease